MKPTRILSALLATALLARADVLPPAQDTSSNKAKLTAAGGKATTLGVSATRKGFVLFNLASLPLDVVATDIANARLRVYFPAAAKPGDIAIHTVTGTWNETAAAAEPGVSVAPVAMFPLATVVGKKFVEVDVTATVRLWRAGTLANNGFAFVASGITNVSIGAKEGSGSGYPCELEVQVDRDGALADGSVGTTQLAVGAAVGNLADGSVPVTKLANSSITVTAGTGLGGGGAVTLGGNVTLTLGSNLTLGGTTTGTFSGDGSGLTNVPFTVGAGSIGSAQLASGLTLGGTTSGTFSGDGSGLTGVPVGSITGNLALPATASGSVGVITQGGSPLLHTFGTGNFFAGLLAGDFTMTGSSNTGVGQQALGANAGGNSNTAVGAFVLNANTEGSDNTGVGRSALAGTTGSANIGIGANAGSNLTTGNFNIAIGHTGVAGESNIIRIGTPGTQTDTYLAGVIHGDGSGLTDVPFSVGAGSIGSAQLASGLTLGGTTTGTFSGDGSGLTGVPFTVGAGSIGSAQLASGLTLGGTTSGTFSGTFNGTFSGDGSGLTGVPFTVGVGSIGSAQLASGLTLGGTTSGTFSGDGSGLTGVPFTISPGSINSTHLAAGLTFSSSNSNPAATIANTGDATSALAFAALYHTWWIGQNQAPDANTTYDNFFIYDQTVGATRLSIDSSGVISGNGSGLTGVNAASIAAGNVTGTISSGQLAPNLALTGTTTGTFSGTFTGDGSGLTNLPGGGGGAGAVTLVDGNAVTLGRVISSSRGGATVLTSTGYQVFIPFDGVFYPAQIYYTGTNGTGTAYLNDGGGGTLDPESISGKYLVYSGSVGSLMEPFTVTNGLEGNETFSSQSIDNPTNSNFAPTTNSGWKLKPITRAAAGLPATFALPITMQ